MGNAGRSAAATPFAEAAEKYKTALAIKPDKHEALNNWGNALADQAGETGAEANRLFAEAGRSKNSARIRPDQHKALNNWGTALAIRPRRKPARKPTACCRTKAALAISRTTQALQLGCAGRSGQDENRQEAERLFAEAAEKYKASLAIKPDQHEALNNGAGRSGQDENRRGGQSLAC